MKLFGPKLPKGGAIEPARRDDINQSEQDALMRRRGGAADIVTGLAGAEAPPGGKIRLGS